MSNPEWVEVWKGNTKILSVSRKDAAYMLKEKLAVKIDIQNIMIREKDRQGTLYLARNYQE